VKSEKVVAYTQHSRRCNSPPSTPVGWRQRPYWPGPGHDVGEVRGLVSQDGATASISVLSFAWLAQQAWLSRTAFGAERSSHARRSPPRMMPQQNKIRALDSYSLRSGYRFLTASYKARALWINEIIAHANPATQARPTTGTKIKNKTTIHVRRKRAAATLLRSSDAGGTVESKASLPRLGWHPAKLLCL
jgi:hypothetical protein